MKKQQKKQAKLIYRMLPKAVVQKMNAGEVGGGTQGVPLKIEK